MPPSTSVSDVFERDGLLRRSVRADGACFYRACLFAALERDYAGARRRLLRLAPDAAPTLPRLRPDSLVTHFSWHDDAMCDLARSAARAVLTGDMPPSMREWIGRVDDAESLAHGALRDLGDRHAWASTETMSCLAEALGIRLVLMFQPSRITLPPGANDDNHSRGTVCLMPTMRQAGNVAAHYDVAYPGTREAGSDVVQLHPELEETVQGTQ